VSRFGDSDRGTAIPITLLAGFVLLLILVILSACQTASVLISAPEEFWITAEKIPLAVLQDAWTVIKWLLGMP